MNLQNNKTCAAQSFSNQKRSYLSDVWHRLKKNKTAVLGLIIIAILILVSLCAPLIADYETVTAMNPQEKYLAPCAGHIFGTDDMGRDYFARIIWGGRASLTIGFLCVLVSLSIGMVLGSVAAYAGGTVDTLIMRIMDTLSCIPSLLLALVTAAALGPGFGNMVIALTLATVPNFTRVIRSVILPLTGQDFIEAARACGTTRTGIIRTQILPNALGPIIVQATMAIAQLIIAAAGLSFLGMGIQPPKPEWGSMLNTARQYIMTSPHMIIFPGLFIVLSALSLNLLGDGLRDALDPRLRN